MQENTTQSWQPANYNTIDPCIPVKGAATFIEFLKQAFDAAEGLSLIDKKRENNVY